MASSGCNRCRCIVFLLILFEIFPGGTCGTSDNSNSERTVGEVKESELSYSLREPRKLHETETRSLLGGAKTETAYDAIIAALPSGTNPIDHYPYTMMRDYSDPLGDSDVALFWHVPKSAGSSLKHILGICLNKLVAIDYGREDFLCRKSVETWGGPEKLGGRVCNSELADVLASVRFRYTLSHFGPDKKSRTFMLFRHPVDRIVSNFHYLAQATWEGNYDPTYDTMTILEHAHSADCPSDWVTRSLLGLLENGYQRRLTQDDLKVAKELLRRKVMVLMVGDIGGAVQRLTAYFGWYDASAEVQGCIQNKLQAKRNNNGHKEVEEGSEAWDTIVEKNRFDMELFFYAYELYEDQKKILVGTN